MPGIMQYDNARLIAVCDVDINRMKDAKKLVENYYYNKTGSNNAVDVKMYNDYKELLQNRDIDAVVISTPDHWHAQPAIEAALAELKKAHESKDIAQIDTAMEKINEAWKVASEEMYKAQAEAQEGGEAPGPDASQNGEAESSDVEDVDFEEVK